MFSKKTPEEGFSLATRLAAALAAAVALSICTIFALVYFAIVSMMHSRIDQKLLHEVAEVSSLVSMNGFDKAQAALLHAAYAEGTDQLFYRVIDAAGTVRMESDTTSWQGVGVGKKAMDAGKGRNPVFETVRIGGGAETARIVYAPLDSGMIVQIAFRVGHEMRPVRDLKRILLGGGAIALAFSTFVAWIIAWRALAPLQTITKTALSIAAGNLDERLATSSRDAELRRLSRAFNMMLDRIQSFVRELRERNDSVAHDVRTLLARTRLASERLLATHPLSDDQESLAVAIVEDSDDLLNMVNSVAELSELSTGVAQIRSAPVDVNEVIADLFEFFETAASEKRIAMCLQAPDRAIVPGDRNRLRRLFANLFDNALKYTEAGGRIEVRIQAGAREVAVSVADTGAGIPLDAQERIFERFYRVDGSRSSDGHGLGLSLASAIAGLHGGSIRVCSEEGKGSTFTVSLPRLAPASAAMQTTPPVPDGSSA